jgi:F0F1-type ATP synthase assembly protein I
MEEAAKFAFIGTAAVAFFGFLTISHWISTVAAERRDRDRLALLKKTAEQPAEIADRLRELLREEDIRAQRRKRRGAVRARRDSLQGGFVVIAVGIGLGIFFRALVPDKPIWTLGIMMVLVGMVIAGFAASEAPLQDADSDD